jgi:hypothetical protein
MGPFEGMKFRCFLSDLREILPRNGVNLRCEFHRRRNTAAKVLMVLVPRVGVEPTRPYGQRILSPQRLPFRHPGDFVKR